MGVYELYIDLVKDFETEEYRAALAISGRWASSTPIRGL